jgi:gamma-glutamylcyclotransferase (GGCT)/AIG2-like uncharacterized protein YtfP
MILSVTYGENKMTTKVDEGKVRVFVYGTLKEGHPNNLVLRNSGAKLLAFETITGPFIMHDLGGIPAVIHDDSGEQNTIKGMVYYGDEEMLAACDMLEGHPNFYKREKVWSDLLKRRVWVYTMQEAWEGNAQDICEDGLWAPTEKETAFWSNFDKGVASGAESTK